MFVHYSVKRHAKKYEVYFGDVKLTDCRWADDTAGLAETYVLDDSGAPIHCKACQTLQTKLYVGDVRIVKKTLATT